MTKNSKVSEAEFVDYIMSNSDGRKTKVKDFVVKHDYGADAYYEGPGGDVVIPKKLDEYARFHFENGAAIRSLTFPGNIKRITSWSFGNAWKNNKHIEELIFEEGVERIEGAVFQNCKKLTKVVLPKSLKYLGSSAFKGSQWYAETCEEEGKCTYIDSFLVSSQEDIEEAVIRPGTKMICRNAFGQRKKLTNVIIPDSVGTIGEMAFCGCYKLQEITVPESVQVIESSAFTGCMSLKKFEVLNRNADIELNLFGSDKSLEVVIPEYAFIPNLAFDDAKPVQKEAFAIEFLTSMDRHSEDEKAVYETYIKKQGKKLTKRIIELSNINALRNIASLYFSKKNIDEFIDLAQKEGSAEVKALLLDWKNNNVTPGDAGKQASKAIDVDPYNSADMKKLWRSKKALDGTLIITKFKGSDDEETIEVPPRIGKTPVTILSPVNYENIFPSTVKNVTLPEGLVVIDGTVFRSFPEYNDLQPVVIPESVKIISGNAFDDHCRPVDIDDRFEYINYTYYRKKGLRRENGMIIVDDYVCGADETDQYENVWVIPKEMKVHYDTKGFPYLYYKGGDTEEKKPNLAKKMKKGNTFEFGRFPQNWNGELETITWMVLEADENTVVAITKDILVSAPMMRTGEAESWEGTDLRQWLNTVFYENAFTDKEKELILPKRTSESSEDKVFVLDREEFIQYFPEYFVSGGEKDAMKQANTYSSARGFYLTGKEKTGSWWLRSLSSVYQRRFLTVTPGGDLYSRGSEQTFAEGVCPVICLKR